MDQMVEERHETCSAVSKIVKIKIIRKRVEGASLQECEKHGYTEDSFPGIFDVEVEHSALIYTPAKVWQLWIYDRCIY